MFAYLPALILLLFQAQSGLEPADLRQAHLRAVFVQRLVQEAAAMPAPVSREPRVARRTPTPVAPLVAATPVCRPVEEPFLDSRRTRDGP